MHTAQPTSSVAVAAAASSTAVVAREVAPQCHADEHLEVEVEEAPVVHAQAVGHAPAQQRPGGGYGVEAGG